MPPSELILNHLSASHARRIMREWLAHAEPHLTESERRDARIYCDHMTRPSHVLLATDFICETRRRYYRDHDHEQGDDR